MEVSKNYGPPKHRGDVGVMWMDIVDTDWPQGLVGLPKIRGPFCLYWGRLRIEATRLLLPRKCQGCRVPLANAPHLGCWHKLQTDKLF